MTGRRSGTTAAANGQRRGTDVTLRPAAAESAEPAKRQRQSKGRIGRVLNTEAGSMGAIGGVIAAVPGTLLTIAGSVAAQPAVNTGTNDPRMLIPFGVILVVMGSFMPLVGYVHGRRDVIRQENRDRGIPNRH